MYDEKAELSELINSHLSLSHASENPNGASSPLDLLDLAIRSSLRARSQKRTLYPTCLLLAACIPYREREVSQERCSGATKCNRQKCNRHKPTR